MIGAIARKGKHYQSNQIGFNMDINFDNNTLFIIFGLTLFLVAIISYLLTAKLGKSNSVQLETTKNELKRLNCDFESQSNTNKQLLARQTELDVKVGKLESEKQLCERDASRIQLELNTSQTELNSIRQSEQCAKETATRLSSELTSATETRDELKVKLEKRDTELNKCIEEISILKVEVSELTANLQSTSIIKDELKTKLGNRDTELNKCNEEISLLKAEVSKLTANLQSTAIVKDELKIQIEQASVELRENKRLNTQLQAEISEVKANLENTLEAKDEQKVELQQLVVEHKALQTTNNEFQQENAEIKTEMQIKQKHFGEQLELLQNSKLELKKEFQNLANEILERKSKVFKEQNSESMASILNPIHQELKGFRIKVEDIHARESEQRVQLRTELKNLQKLNKEITDQADKLTTALKGEKKTQGNWGELMLENVLDNSGLRLGKDYKREVSVNTENGKLRPDVIVFLPQSKHLIIDAKTSLNAYTRYVNAEDDLQRNIALKEHTDAVRDRINELANKEYYKLPGLNSPEVVVMFIPVESAYVAALKADESLYQNAIDHNVLVATPTTLLTSLNIVRQLWRFEDQNKHTAELANRAEKFYSKLNTFLTSMQGLGKQLDKSKDTYNKSFSQLYTGRGNLIKQAAEFKELGVSVQNELPAELIEKASLELGGTSPDQIDEGIYKLESDEVTA
ncbi:MAG: DNA recombination protein RmuC [Alteromonadaceae bacterium]